MSIIPIGKVGIMKISAKSEYGIIALIDVANHFGSEPVQVRKSQAAIIYLNDSLNRL